jgi:CheY-like chemotaxis protein
MHPPTILVVDDSEPYLLFVRLALSSSCDVVLASSAERALEEVLRRRPDVVLTDYSMPERTGLDLIERLKPRLPDVPIVLMSSALPPEAAARALALGAHDAVEKPTHPRELRELVAGALAGMPTPASRFLSA